MRVINLKNISEDNLTSLDFNDLEIEITIENIEKII